MWSWGMQGVQGQSSEAFVFRFLRGALCNPLFLFRQVLFVRLHLCSVSAFRHSTISLRWRRLWPLAKKKALSLEDLRPFPRLSYEQGSHNSFYFSEEILSTVDCDKELIVCDRATLFNMLIGLNGYTICSGVISEELNGPNIVAKPLKVDDYMEIGYILRAGFPPSQLTERYIEFLRECVPTTPARSSRLYLPCAPDRT